MQSTTHKTFLFSFFFLSLYCLALVIHSFCPHTMRCNILLAAQSANSLADSVFSLFVCHFHSDRGRRSHTGWTDTSFVLVVSTVDWWTTGSIHSTMAFTICTMDGYRICRSNDRQICFYFIYISITQKQNQIYCHQHSLFFFCFVSVALNGRRDGISEIASTFSHW